MVNDGGLVPLEGGLPNCDPVERSWRYTGFMDQLTSANYSCPVRLLEGIELYGRYVRQVLDNNVFKGPIEMAHKICSETIHRDKYPFDGNRGRLIIRVKQAIDTMQTSGCDQFSHCDFYIKIFINSEEKYRTREIDETDNPKFNEVFVSDAISKTDTIRVEAWDSDSTSNDDLMQTVEGDVSHFLSNACFATSQTRNGYSKIANVLCLQSTWTVLY